MCAPQLSWLACNHLLTQERVLWLFCEIKAHSLLLFFPIYLWTFSLHFRLPSSPASSPDLWHFYQCVVFCFCHRHLVLEFPIQPVFWCLRPLFPCFPLPAVLCCMFILPSSPSALIIIVFIWFWGLIGGPWAISYSARLSFSSASYINLQLTLSLSRELQKRQFQPKHIYLS